MIINKFELLNDVRDANAEFLYEGYQDVDDRNNASLDMKEAVFDEVCNREDKDFESDDDRDNAFDDFWNDNELCFVKRDSVLSSALMDFYAPNGTVNDFEQAAKKNIFGFYPQLLPSEDKAINDGDIMGSDEEGFWFVAGNDYLDSLVPHKEQQAFMESVNPSSSLKRDVIHSLSNAESNNITQLLDEIQDNLEQREPRQDYEMALDELKSARNKLDL